MANVITRPRRNDTPEKMIRRFTKKVKKVGLIEEVKRRRYYEKPTQKRRRLASERKRAIEKAKQLAKRKKATNYRRQHKKGRK